MKRKKKKRRRVVYRLPRDPELVAAVRDIERQLADDWARLQEREM